MDLTILRCIFPYNLSGFATLYAEGALLCVADISRCGLNFFCVIFALFQIVFQLDITIAVGGILANNVLILVFDQETHTRNRVFRHAVNLLDADAGHLGIFKFHCGQFTSLYNNILRICVDTVAIGRLDLGYDIDAVLQTGNVDQTGRIGGILTDALAGHLLNLEFRACECFASTLNHLANLQAIRFFVGKGQLIGLTGLDLNGLGGVLQDISGRRCNLGYDQSAIRQAVQRNRAVYIGFCFLNQFAIRLSDLKFRIFQRLTGFLIDFLDGKTGLLLVGKSQLIAAACFDLDCLGRILQDVAVRGLNFGYYQRAIRQAGKRNCTVFVRFGFLDEFAVRLRDFEFRVFQRLTGIFVHLFDNKLRLLGILKGDFIGLTLAELHRFRRFVYHITGRGLNFGDDIYTSIQFGDMNNAVHIAYNILTDNAAITARDLERCTRQRLAGLCVHLLNQQTGLLAVLNSKSVGLTLFQRYRVRGLVDDVAAGCGNLGYDVIRCIKALNECGTVLAGTNIFLDYIAVCASQLKDCTGQRLLGFGVDLGDGQSRLLGVLNSERSVLIGGMLDLVRLVVQNVLFQGRNFLHLVSACRGLFDGDFTVFIGGVVTEQSCIAPDFELHARQRLLGLAVHLDDLELLLYGVVHYEINISVRRMLDGDRFLIQHITRQRVILLEGVSAAVSIRNGKLAVRAGGKVADALAVLEALENNTLQRFTGILVNLGDGNVLLHHIGNSEERRVLGIVFDGEYLFIQHILRVGDDLLRLISARLCIRKPDTTICAGGVVAEQLAVLVDGKGYALNRLVGFTVDFQNTEMLLDGIGKGKGRDFGLILYQFNRLLTGVHVVMLGIAAGFLNAVSTRLEIFNHRFAVLVGSYGREVSIVVVNIKLPAGQRNLGFLVDFHNTDG